MLQLLILFCFISWGNGLTDKEILCTLSGELKYPNGSSLWPTVCSKSCLCCGPALDGVYCDRDDNQGRVTELYFLNVGLTGTILPQITNLTKLQALLFGNNHLEGTLPPIENLPDLRELNFSLNKFTGGLLLRDLPSLTLLYVNSNGFSGPLPDLKGCTKLQRIYFYRNNFEGSIPDYSNFPDLGRLWLHNNLLEGPIPNFKNLPSIKAIHLYGNSLTGPVPEFEDLMSLEDLYIGTNFLSGQLPSFKSHINLRRLLAAINDLDGTIPAYAHMVELDLAKNRISGTIPSSITTFHQLEKLELEFNFLFGSIPPFLDLEGLTKVTLDGNNFTGPIPTFNNVPLLETLSLSGNHLTGTIPSFPFLGELTWLDLSNNQLNGTIPGLENLPALATLYLESNELSGPIPRFNQTQLQLLVLSVNRLNGTIPAELGQLPQLRVFEALNNNLTGGLPPLLNSPIETMSLGFNRLSDPIRLDSRSNLKVLHVESNLLTHVELDSVPRLSMVHLQGNCLENKNLKLGNLTALSYLDLSRNLLTNYVSPMFDDSFPLKNLFLRDNMINQTLPEQEINPSIIYLDLSRNQIHGSIDALFFFSNLVLGNDQCPHGGKYNYSTACQCARNPDDRVVIAYGNKLQRKTIYIVEILDYQRRRIFSCSSRLDQDRVAMLSVVPQTCDLGHYLDTNLACVPCASAWRNEQMPDNEGWTRTLRDFGGIPDEVMPQISAAAYGFCSRCSGGEKKRIRDILEKEGCQNVPTEQPGYCNFPCKYQNKTANIEALAFELKKIINPTWNVQGGEGEDGSTTFLGAILNTSYFSNVKYKSISTSETFGFRTTQSMTVEIEGCPDIQTYQKISKIIEVISNEIVPGTFLGDPDQTFNSVVINSQALRIDYIVIISVAVALMLIVGLVVLIKKYMEAKIHSLPDMVKWSFLLRWPYEFQKLEFQKNSTNWKRFTEFFEVYLSGGDFDITGIWAVNNSDLVDAFISKRRAVIQLEKQNKPNRYSERTQDPKTFVYQKYKEISELMKWNNVSEAEKLIPVVHATTRAAALSICLTGFALFENFAHDEGYYGQGLYFSRNAFYALQYSKENDPVLVVAWIIPGKVFPITDEGKIIPQSTQPINNGAIDLPSSEKPPKNKEPESIGLSAGSSAKNPQKKQIERGYNSHYVLTDFDGESNFNEISSGPFDEFVIGETAQILPAFLVFLDQTKTKELKKTFRERKFPSGTGVGGAARVAEPSRLEEEGGRRKVDEGYIELDQRSEFSETDPLVSKTLDY